MGEPLRSIGRLRLNLPRPTLLTMIETGREIRIMTVYYVAAVAPIVYPSLYRLCDGRLPDTFWDWRLREDETRRGLVANGHHVIGICVVPGDLQQYCRSMNCQADGAALNALAARFGAERYGGVESYERVRAQTVVVEDARGAPVTAGDERVLVEDVPPIRRHWWQLWKRPGFARRRPLAVRTAA